MAPLELDLTDLLRTFELRARLTVEAETFALVGPSGAGKSTILRHVAGLRTPSAGRITLGDDVWFDSARRIDRAPDRRSVGLVFQEYALFPHLTVAANVAFGGASQARVGELLERFRIGHLAREKPTRLSGGERQRVAVARALGRDPQVLLLDEPLSALDAHTRAAVREELADILAAQRIPTLMVTHDFLDASTLADRVGVIRDGRLHQIGRPEELTAHPADEFVASLTGGNLLHGEAEGTRVTLDDGTVIEVAEPARGRVGVAVYPWEIAVTSRPPAAGNVLAGTVGAITPDRGRTRVRVGPLVAEVGTADGLERGARAYASFAPGSARVIR
ncbi:ABC transporter ATP-binding protein [Solirubrobacter sp. CPCC 204708]|uniref:ABC transporter ATP-binding protein n=1 Tax=Solirubrobacter deserti TaxID=2282478 RepID=A0ABT4RIV0_9ACTN|nr:ABC transporter ATP-binding protein [Solirubrobacter deserti]MBE2320802.1 ABC transporter ATP-binding protein [Solirubrobacter deserti]MDA0138437.1 ABC transporter ATP-binding protein [Solirubrobacter deserti]